MQKTFKLDQKRFKLIIKQFQIKKQQQIKEQLELKREIDESFKLKQKEREILKKKVEFAKISELGWKGESYLAEKESRLTEEINRKMRHIDDLSRSVQS